MKKCKMENCQNINYAKGYCLSHYMRFNRYGDPSGGSRFNYGKGWVRKDGYRVINRVRENRLVMERFLGRKLTQNEDVHHINGNKLDNRIENLKVVTKHVHGVYLSGRRKYIKCTIKGCNRGHKALGLCQNHYMQHWRKLKINSLENKKCQT